MTAEKQKRDLTFARVKPCKKCPFRTDVPPYLNAARVGEIATSIQQGGPFHCHETTVPSDDGESMEVGPDSSVCAGSIIVMEKMGQPNQHLRIAERLGLYDPKRMHMDSPVHDSWVAVQRHHGGRDEEEEQGQTCEVVGPGCEAPAGYMVNGAVVEGTEYVEGECSECGRPVCDACSTVVARYGDDVTVCIECEEDEDED